MANGQAEAIRNPLQGFLDADKDTVVGVSDRQLLARFAAHRDELAEIAFAVLVHRHGPMVLRVCRQILGDWHTAEDAFQATFLILARKAGSIHQPELLGHWLHGVALRTAREARMRHDRRRRKESPREERIGAEPIDETARPESLLVGREEFEALHEEVSRLPERYRIPVVLCELEGLTYQEAALRLRCPVRTIGVRLRRARERLRVRLTRRGLAPTAGLMGALLGAEADSAELPSVLVESTVQAATRLAANQAAATGLVSPLAGALVEAVRQTMALTPLKVALSLALAVGIAATAGWVVAHRASPALLAPTPGQPQAAEEAPLSENPAAPVPGDRPTPLSTMGARLEFAVSMLNVLFKSNPKREERIARDGNKPGREPESAVARGAVLFAKEWVPNDPRSRGGDGLGPVYNATSCVACHALGAPGGAGPESTNVVLVTATPTGRGVAQGLDQIHPGLRGSRSAVVHRYGTDPEYGSWRRRFYESHRDDQPNGSPNPGGDSIQARIQALKEQTEPSHRLRERLPRLRPMNGFKLSLSERNTPALFGAGRIDAIPSEVLVAVAKRQRADVQGRISRTSDGRIGRFGWKAQIASLHEFTRAACANELGLEVPGHEQGASPLAPSEPAKGLDMTDAECDELVAYIRALPAPAVVDPDGPQGTRDMREGRRLFVEVGCTSCHTPTLGDVRGIYSDLLLHVMGQESSDSGGSYGSKAPSTPEGPTPLEWRTPPLWGYRDSGPYMHDGRAQKLEEAVALHGGQGQASAHQFFGLSSQERFQVEAFLKSLVAPSASAVTGVVLAAERESRIEQKERPVPESLMRRQREEAAARDSEQWREAHRRRRTEQALNRARAQIPIAQALEKMGKFTGALEFYTKIAREVPDTEEGRLAAARVAALRTTRDLLEPTSSK
jgi:RNA polymerase sigma factor (sigma-70 family)